MPLTDKDKHITKAFQKEKRDAASQLLKDMIILGIYFLFS